MKRNPKATKPLTVEKILRIRTKQDAPREKEIGDIDAYTALMDRIEDRYSHGMPTEFISKLTRSEFLLYSAHWLKAQIEGDGLDVLARCENLDDVIDFLKRAGVRSTASVLQKARKHLPDVPEKLDREFYQAIKQEDFEGRVLDYVETHPEEFDPPPESFKTTAANRKALNRSFEEDMAEAERAIQALRKRSLETYRSKLVEMLKSGNKEEAVEFCTDFMGYPKKDARALIRDLERSSGI